LTLISHEQISIDVSDQISGLQGSAVPVRGKSLTCRKFKQSKGSRAFAAREPLSPYQVD
jgi:hypothetical protein